VTRDIAAAVSGLRCFLAPAITTTVSTTGTVALAKNRRNPEEKSQRNQLAISIVSAQNWLM
jgi:hypothetical protein